MRLITLPTCALCLLGLVMFISGCSEPTTGPIEISGPPPATGPGHDHDHSSAHHGPHNGQVIELGRNHEFHAELVEDDEAGTVTVYILDKDLKEVAVDQKSIMINLSVDGQAKSFELQAAGAAAGTTSRFEATERALFDALHDHQTSGRLRVTINGSPYSGEIEHHHHHSAEDGDQGSDHAGHQH